MPLNVKMPVFFRARRGLSTQKFIRDGDLRPGHTIIGAFAATERVFTSQDVADFARLTGDVNPIHLNADFAALTSFERPIVHGILLASLFSFLVSFDGAIYLQQDLHFKRPIHVGSIVRARVEVVESRRLDGRSTPSHYREIVTCSTTCLDAENRVAIDGYAKVIIPFSSP